MGEYRYKAFISYSHADERWGRWLHRQLEAFQLPSRTGKPVSLPRRPLRPVFRDRDELASSSDLSQSLVDALRDSENLVIVCSRHAAASKWVNAELQRFIDMGRSDRIFPLIIDGDIDEVFPPAFSESGITPLAADVNQDGRRNALLKVVAGLLSLRFDELRGRHEQQRRKRLLAITSVSLAGFVLTTALAAYAWFARAQAEGERQAAEDARETAQQVTGFIVGILEKANPTNRNPDEISVRDVLDQGYEAAKADLADRPRVRAEVLTAIANAYNTLGLFEANIEIREDVLEAVRASSGGPNADVGRALVNYAGSLGSLDTPESNRHADMVYDEAIAYLRALNPPDHYLLGTAHIGRGVQFQYTGRLEASRREFESAITELRSMTQPDHVKIAWAHNNTGNTWLSEPRLYRANVERALAQFRHADSIIQAHSLDDAVLSSTVALNLGASYLLLSDPIKARQVVEPAHRSLVRLLEAHPRTVYATRLLGNAAAMEGDLAEAGRRFEEALDLARQLEGGSRDQLLGIITTYKGDLAKQMGQATEATALYEEALRYFGSPAEPEAALDWLDERVERYPLREDM